MITGTDLMAFIRQASKISTNKQTCTALLNAEIYDFSQAIYLLFSAFVHHMSRIGLLPQEMAANAKCFTLSDLKEKNRVVLRELRFGSTRLFSKTEYNFGLFFLYLYYFQRILDILLPKDTLLFSDDNENEGNILPFQQRMTQEEVVTMLTGSKDRTNVHATLPVVCTDLAAIMNRQLSRENPRFQKLTEKLKNLPGRRLCTLIKGIRGSGKSDFLLYLGKTGMNIRYYPQGEISSLSESISWLKSSVENSDFPHENETLIILENTVNYTIWEIYDLSRALEQYNGKERIHLICTARSQASDSLYDAVISGFSRQTLEMPMMETASITENLERENLMLDPVKVSAETFGYPPLVNYCITHRTEEIPLSIYFKTFTILFEVKTTAELIRALLFLNLIKNDVFNENTLKTAATPDTNHLFDWQPFLRKAQKNGLLEECRDPGKWFPAPIVLFLAKKIVNKLG